VNIIEALFSWFLACVCPRNHPRLGCPPGATGALKRLSAVSRYARSGCQPSLCSLRRGCHRAAFSAERWFAARTPTPVVRTVVDPNAAAAGGYDTVEKKRRNRSPGSLRTTGTGGKTGAVIWLTGCTVFLVGSIAAYLATLRRIRSKRGRCGPAVEALLRQAAAECGIANPPRLLIPLPCRALRFRAFCSRSCCCRRSSPVNSPRARRRLVLVHELIHLRRWDLPALNWVLCLLQAIHWCNPLLWFVFGRIRDLTARQRAMRRSSTPAARTRAPTTVMHCSSSRVPALNLPA
jgi:hypothetical protein